MLTEASVTEAPHGGVHRGGSPNLLVCAFDGGWRAAACALAYAAGTIAGGMLLPVVHVPPPALPAGVDAAAAGRQLLLCALILAAGLVPLSRRLQGSFVRRWLALAGFAYVGLGVCPAIEASVFSRLGGMWAMAAMAVPSSLLFAAAVAWLFPARSRRAEPASGVVRLSLGTRMPERAGRLVLAWLAFPAVYTVFGMAAMAAAPWVLEMYRTGSLGLVLPPLSTVLATQLGRSVLFLASTLPLLALWRGGRRELVWVLALASFVSVGLFGMLQASWWPISMRAVHSVEMLFDAVAYAWLLAAILMREEIPGPAA